MCGLTGIWDRSGSACAQVLGSGVGAMSDAIVARGPDDSGIFVDADAHLALGFRRLAIVDLSPAGHQPMASGDGRFVVAFNGEIYNHAELRRELAEAGIRFRGTSDTEVMLEAFARWGIEATLPRLNGMFAIALWDRRERRLHLVRDPIGIKPLYWARVGETLLFGSELKALRAHPAMPAEIDRAALAAYLRLGYVPAPHSIYRGVHKLEPGTWATIDASGEPRSRRYWSLDDIARRGTADPFAGSDEEAVAHFDHLLRDAVAKQMVADVPLGAFLSGGIDSSTVVALMQARSPRPVRTFTIGFEETRYNEAVAARALAAHLGTDHTEAYVTPADARSVIPRLPDIHDEPFADASSIPTFLLSRMTRARVTVALSGDGGDELLAGYARYGVATGLWRTISAIPQPLRPLAAAAFRTAARPSLDALIGRAPDAFGLKLSGHRLGRLADTLRAPDPDWIFRDLVSLWSEPGAILCDAGEAPHPLIDGAARRAVPDFSRRMRFLDMATYLPDDVLTKVDRTSMAVSLEARVPLLDTRVAAFCWRLPHRMLVREGKPKWLLRQVLGRYVPQALVERPKMGFSVPIDQWLRQPLREWAEDLLSERSLAASGLAAAPIRRRWARHLSGAENAHGSLWAVLMLQAWMRRWQ